MLEVIDPWGRTSFMWQMSYILDIADRSFVPRGDIQQKVGEQSSRNAHRSMVLRQEAKYVERWPSTTSAWAGWSRFDIPVDRYGRVHSLLICTSSPLGFPTCHQASQQENTYWTKYQKADRASTLVTLWYCVRQGRGWGRASPLLPPPPYTAKHQRPYIIRCNMRILKHLYLVWQSYL
jgi:hypothetical protein